MRRLLIALAILTCGLSTEAPSRALAGPYCVGVPPLCLQGHPQCVCDTTGLNCYWACAGAR